MEYIREFFGDAIIGVNSKNESYNTIKLSYFKLKSKDENHNEKFGIQILKEQTDGGYTKFDTDEILNLTNIEEDIEKYLLILKENLVTPITLYDVIEDLEKQKFYKKHSTRILIIENINCKL